jgi:hypothetical protein
MGELHVKRGPQTESSRRRASASAKAYWSDSAIRAAHGEKTRRRMDRPEVRATISERTKVALADPDVNARQREGLKRAFADPALRQRISELTKAGMAAKLDRQFADLVKIWETMPKKVRQRFLAHVCGTS